MALGDNIGSDNSLIEKRIQDKIDLLPDFEETYRKRYYGWTSRIITLDEDAAKLKKLEFNNEIDYYKAEIVEAKKILEELNPKLEAHNSNEPSGPIIDPYNFYYFMYYTFLPLLFAMLVLFVFTFNASMNAYIYSKLRDK